jgi:hypothetical protein
LRVVYEVLGSVAPLLYHGLLHPAGVLLGVDANLLGDLDAVWLGDEPGKENGIRQKENICILLALI